MTKKGICKERRLHIVSVTSQVALSRQVRWFKLAFWGPPRDEMKKGRRGRVDANGVGLVRRC